MAAKSMLMSIGGVAAKTVARPDRAVWMMKQRLTKRNGSMLLSYRVLCLGKKKVVIGFPLGRRSAWKGLRS
ncbi:unnamed protein product [Calypogeia fissa]